jgi:hypothetical protein
MQNQETNKKNNKIWSMDKKNVVCRVCQGLKNVGMKWLMMSSHFIASFPSFEATIF